MLSSWGIHCSAVQWTDFRGDCPDKYGHNHIQLCYQTHPWLCQFLKVNHRYSTALLSQDIWPGKTEYKYIEVKICRLYRDIIESFPWQRQQLCLELLSSLWREDLQDVLKRSDRLHSRSKVTYSDSPNSSGNDNNAFVCWAGHSWYNTCSQ